MAERNTPAVVIHYRPAPPALGANLDAGASVIVEGMVGGPLEGIVVPDEPSDLHDQLPPEAHEALNRAAASGTGGTSGSLRDDLPW